MSENIYHPLRRGRACCFAVLAASLLSGCASQSGSAEDKVGSFLVAPGKYGFYTCAHLIGLTAGLKARERELEALIAKAGPGAGGGLVSAVSYHPQLLQVRGNLIEVRKAEAEKKCPPPVAAAPAVPPAVQKPKRG